LSPGPVQQNLWFPSQKYFHSNENMFGVRFNGNKWAVKKGCKPEKVGENQGT
jgi:hypothetical protein